MFNNNKQTFKYIKMASADTHTDTKKVAEKKQKIGTIGNLYDLKKAFCNKEYKKFTEMLTDSETPFVLLKATTDNTEFAMDFLATNRLNGYGQTFGDLVKWSFVCFKCYKLEGKEFSFVSYWIVNTTAPLESIPLDEKGFIFDAWNFTTTTSDELIKFFMDTEDNLFDVSYTH